MSDPELKKRRAQIIAEKKAKKAAVMDSAVPPSDANPNHREDFNSLLNAAVEKPAQED